jgi:HEAT repeat protein
MKRIVPALFLLLFAGRALAADEITEVYRRIYMEAEGLQQKSSAILDLVRLEDRETAPILAEALAELLQAQANYASPSEKELFARTVRVVAIALGDYKYDDAAPSLWTAIEQVPDSLAKAEALIAIGKIRALDYAERIALLLRDLNLKPTADVDAGEKLAYGAILSLEKLRDPRGFSPVFFATDAWYSQRIKQQAERSLPNIAEDPTDSIVEILGTETPARMYKALRAEIASKAPLERKAGAALLALNLGHQKMARDKVDERLYGDLRKLALRSLVSYKASGPEPVDSCLASYEKGFDDEERLLGLQALGANGSDPAARGLRDILLKLNDQQRSGLGDENRNRMAKAAIENAALSKNRLVKPVLLLIANNDKWSGGIISAAKAAQAAIP